MRKNPDSTDMLWDLSDALLETEQYDRAQSVYEQLLKKQPEEKDLLCGLAASLHGRGRTAEALSVYRKADANIKAGELLLAAGRQEEALAEFNISMQRDQQPVFTDDDGKAHYNELSSYNDQAYYHAGMILHQRGETELALTHFKKFLELLDSKTAGFFTAVTGRKDVYDQYRTETRRVIQILKEGSVQDQEPGRS